MQGRKLVKTEELSHEHQQLRAAPAARQRQRHGQRECSPASTLIWTLSLQNYESIRFCCFKLRSLWYFVLQLLLQEANNNKWVKVKKPNSRDRGSLCSWVAGMRERP